MRFFSADPHFGHDNHNGGIVKMMARVRHDGRLMSCIEEHDQILLDEINSRVGRDDELIFLGDFAWDKPGKYRAQINCRNVKLVLGNHDKITKSLNVFGNLPVQMFSKATKYFAGEINVHSDSFKLHLTHMPMMFWEQSHNGWGHLYGHCHGQREEYLDALEPQRRAFDVGVDNVYRLYGHYGPLSEEEVYDYLGRRSGHDDVRFYEDYQRGLYLDRGLL